MSDANAWSPDAGLVVPPPMQRLVQGVHEFQVEYFTKHRKLFERLAERGQSPDTIFITCSDSRVVPHLITNSQPGDLFIIRNAGNIVPDMATPGGTIASIEYAIEALEIPNVVVCGHTHCGAVQTMLSPETAAKLPYVRRWLAQGERVRDIVNERYSDLKGNDRVVAAVEENVLVQLENLRAFPFFAKRLEQGKVTIAGWVFKIETGQVFNFDPDTSQFVELTTETNETAK